MAKTKIPKSNETLLLALACGANQEAAAQKAGLSRRTLGRRLEDPTFRKKLNALRADMVQRATGMLPAGTLEAVKTLLALQTATTPPSARKTSWLIGSRLLRNRWNNRINEDDL